jgi:uncharacterized protein YegL
MGPHGLHLIDSKAWEKHYELPIHGVRSQRQMHRLMSKLAELQRPADRLQQLVYEMKTSPQAFSGDQVIELAPYFPGTELVLALHLFDHHLFGLRCDQAVRLLQMIPVPEQRVDALRVIDENLLDPVNRFQLRNLFPPYLLPQVDQLLAEVRGQSHIYGSVTSTRVIFLIDTSGSMSTEFRTNCGQNFNRLQFIVHDLHKILHHRVQPQLKFNIIHFGTHVHRWEHSLTPATAHHLKQAEHYLDHLQADGQTNTYDALKQALTDEEADTIYLLSDGEPSMDIRTILLDLKVWLQQRRNPCVIHTIAFLMGNRQNDPRPREFMAEIAIISGGIFRCIDPFTPLHQEFGGASYSDNPNFNDDEFVQYFEGRLSDVPPQLLQSFGLYPRQQYAPSTMGAPRIPYQTRPLYPVQQYPSPPPNANYQPPQQNMPFVMAPYQGQGFQNHPPPNFKLQIKSRPRLQDEIDIPSLHHEQGHDRFDIRLNIRQIVPRHDGQWSVSHTVDEFKQLHHELQKRCSVPPFPPNHHSLIHMSKHDQEIRRQELEAYLKQLYVYVSPYEHPEFDLFLLMELHVNQIVQQAEVEWKTYEQQQPTAPYNNQPPPPPYGPFIK